MTPNPQDRELGAGSLWPRLVETWEELQWPRVLSGARHGLRPALAGLGFFAIVTVGLLITVGLRIDAWLGWGGGVPVWPWLEDPGRTWLLLPWRLYVTIPKSLVWGLPVTTLVFGPLAIFVWVVMLGAVGRMVASEVSLGRRISWTQGLAFSLRHWVSLVGAVLGPLVALWLIALMMGAAGYLLMSWPVVNLLGAVLFGVYLLGAAAAVVTAVGYMLGRGLLVPAVVCEGADAVDAIQRVYGYVLGRPLRLAFYLALAVLGVAVVVGILGLLTYWTIGFAAQGAGVWAGGRGGGAVWTAVRDAMGFAGPAGSYGEPPAGTFAAAAWIIRLWSLIPLGLLLGTLVSCATAAMTMVYLAMRRVCDGQDVAELWIPGAIEANMAAAMSGRARAAAELGTPAATRPVAGDADDL